MIFELDARLLIQNEISSVLTALRKNARWHLLESGSSFTLNTSLRKSKSAQNLLMPDAKFGSATASQTVGPLLFHPLIAELRHCQDIRHLDARTLLQPFLVLVKSSDTSGPITSAVLSSIDKFINYEIIHQGSPSLKLALTDLVTAATHCKFEASDSISDEVVLLKILEVLKNCLLHEVLGNQLNDECVCMIMETGLSMCCQMRLSELLRRSAEKTMQSLLRAVFTRLRFLRVDEEECISHSLDLSHTPSGDLITSPDTLLISKPDPSSQSLGDSGGASNPVELQTAEDTSPYGLPAVRELLRVLIALLDPYDATHTDSMRALGLSILQTAFEIGGTSMAKFRVLRQLICDTLCKHVLELIRSQLSEGSAGSGLLAPCLRFMTIVFDTMRTCLRLQLELYISFLLDRINNCGREQEQQLDAITWNSNVPVSSLADPKSTGSGLPPRDTASPAPGLVLKKEAITNEAKALLLDHLCLLLQDPGIAPTLWYNFDTHVESEDLLERSVHFLARAVYVGNNSATNPTVLPSIRHSPTDNIQSSCLESLLTFVQAMHTRINQQSAVHQNFPSSDRLSKSKASKRLLLQGATLFNAKPKQGLAFLEEHGFIYGDDQAASGEQRTIQLAKFLKNSVRLDKRELGDYLSRPENVDLLKAYIGLFDFRDKLISDAMRELLETFRLPGEAQQIARITEAFAELYSSSQNPEKSFVKDADSAYVLSYSVIMLNTDQHNPQNVKNRMKFEDYKKNLRGVNAGADFDETFLQDIFDDIRRREIVLPDEHSGQLGFEYAWKELLRQSDGKEAGTLTVLNCNQYDRDIFSMIWKPIVAALTFSFNNVQSEDGLQSIIAGLRQCFELADRHGCSLLFDYTVVALAGTAGLSLQREVDTSIFPVAKLPASDDNEYTQVTVSPLSVRFGHETKAQLAAIILCNLATIHGPSIQTGWANIFELLACLFLHSLLPASLSLGTTIPLKPPQPAANVNGRDRLQDSGLLSTLSSYLLSPYAQQTNTDGLGRELTEEDIDSTLVSIDAIASCHLDDLWRVVQSLPAEGSLAVVEAIKELAERAMSSRSATQPPTPLSRAPRQITYDPIVVFYLESLVVISSSANSETQRAIWEPVFEFCAQILSNSGIYSPLLVERSVVGLLKVASNATDALQNGDPIFASLSILEKLPPAILTSVADQLVAGVTTILQFNSAHKETAARPAFQLLQHFLQTSGDGTASYTLDAVNFLPYIDCLNAFTSVASQKGVHEEITISEKMADRGKKALDMIKDTQDLIGPFIEASQLPFNQAWEIYWIPVLSAYAQQSTNAVRMIRQTSLAHLQRTLITQELLSNPKVDLLLIFNKVIFPTIDELLKPQVFRRDPHAAGMGETRLRACALLCKIFLHCAATPARVEQGQLVGIWARVLDALDRMMHSGRRDAMYEAVPEQLKNAILVMAAQGILVPPSEPNRNNEQIAIAEKTLQRIDTFLPSLQQELFPNQALPQKSMILQYSRVSSQVASPRMDAPAPVSQSQDVRRHSHRGSESSAGALAMSTAGL